MSASFGIHVGNTSACLAVSKDGKTDVVANAAGDRVTPAMVAFTDTEIVVGVAAKQGRLRNASNTVANNKILMVGKVDESVISNSQVNINENGGEYKYSVDYKEKEKLVSPSEILNHVYKYVHAIAESHSSTDVNQNNTVLTVPLSYTAADRAAVAKCAKEAGFNVVQVISEPTAACLAYSLGQIDLNERFHCLVLRVGGISMTASVVLVSGGCYSVIDTIDCQVGGDAVTDVLVAFLAKEFKVKYKADIMESKKGRAKLSAQAETVKHVLSTLDTAHCYVESLYDGMDFSTNVTRARFENEMSRVMTKFMDPIEDLLEQCKLEESDISKVILCGGSTKVIKIQKALAGMFPDAELLTSLAGDEVIAIGAGMQASVMTKTPPEEAKVTALAISQQLLVTGPGVPDGKAVLVAADTLVPAKRTVALTLSEGATTTAVTISWGTEEQVVASMELEDLDANSNKVSVSVHIHRDGSCHFILTDKTSGKSADATLKTPSAQG